LIRAGLTDEQIADLILASPLGAKAKEKRYPRRWLLDDISRARRKAVARPHLARVFPDVREAIAAARFPGKAGATDRAVLQAHLQIAEQIGQLRFDASERRIAELAGVSRQTAHWSRRRLAEQGWLTQLKPARYDRASTWEIRIPEDGRERSHIYTPPQRGYVATFATPLGHDAFRWAALGKAALRVWETLSLTEPVSAADAARRAQVGYSTVKGRHGVLRKLQAADLADHTDQGWVRLPGDLDAAAAELGTQGSSDRQKRLHARERQAYQDHLGTCPALASVPPSPSLPMAQIRSPQAPSQEVALAS
jgi:hypothetical protein